MKNSKYIAFLLALSFIVGSLPALADTNNLSGTEDFPPEISITKDGKVKAQGVKVMQIAGSTIFARFIWQEAFLRLTLKTDSRTIFTRRYGDALNISDISVGDWLVVEGGLEHGSESFSINATKIKDVSIFTKDEVKVTGTIIETVGGGSILRTNTKEYGVIEIRPDGNTTITKGSLNISPKDINIGDTVISAKGVYDTAKKSLKTRTMEIYVNKNIFIPRNFQGTLKEIRGTGIPTTLVINAEGKDYTVKITDQTAIMRANRALTTLARFVVGDTVRFYGNITEADLNVVDNVLVVRNVSL